MLEVSSFSASIDLQAAAETPTVPRILYSRQEASYALNISIRSLDALIAASRIKVRRLGRRITVPVSEVQRFARADHGTLTRHGGDIG